MRFLSLFAGIGGFDLGLERAGHACAGQVEIDPFCQRVLRTRFASVERQADVRVAAFDDGGRGIDLLVGGFPCQDLSVAGKRAGLAGERSGLFWEIVRIAKIIKPKWGLFENVPGLLSSRRGADMWTVLAGLRQCWPAVGFRVLDSRYFGVPQRRRRVFFVCGPTEAGVRAVLFEPEGGTGHPAASGEAGTRVAASLTSGVGASSNDPGRRREDDVNLVVSRPLVGTMFKGHDEDTDTLVASCLDGSPYADREAEHTRLVATLNSGGNDGGFRTEPGEHLVAHALSAEGADASEDGTGRGTPLVAATLNPGHEAKHTYPGDGGTMNLIPIQDVRGIREKRQNGIGVGSDGDAMFTLDSVSRHAVGVRRLTPLECERLQSFPDGHTCLCGAYDECRTALRAVYEAAHSQGLSLWQVRRDIHAAEEALLRLVVCEAVPRSPRGLHAGFGTEAGAALIHALGLRPLWWDFGSEPTPQRREHAQQLARELGIDLPFLSHETPLGRGHVCEAGRCVVGEGQKQHYWEVCHIGDEIADLCTCPDSPRYRALGNAVTVNVIEWIGRRLIQVAA